MMTPFKQKFLGAKGLQKTGSFRTQTSSDTSRLALIPKDASRLSSPEGRAEPLDRGSENPLASKPPVLSYRSWMQKGTIRASVFVGAGVVTVTLLGMMTVLIADEFEPQDTVELANFKINPKLDDIALLAERTPPKLLDRIEVPPPPPPLDIPLTNRPSEPIITVFNPDTPFDPKLFITKTVFTITPSDTDPIPLVRVSDNAAACRSIWPLPGIV